MSEEIKRKRKEETIKILSLALYSSFTIVALMVIFYGIWTLMPHSAALNDIVTMPVWQYTRDAIMFLLGGTALTVFTGFFAYWLYQDTKLLKQEKKEAIREIVNEVLKEEKRNE